MAAWRATFWFAAVFALAIAPLHADSQVLDAAGGAQNVADSASAALHRVGAVLMNGDVAYSGWVEVREASHVLAKTPFDGGLESGIAQAWYHNGALRFSKLYRHGKREGQHRGYWPNGQLQFVYNYANDVFEGEQQAFHESGKHAELSHYVGGHEEGQQQRWDQNGQLQSNYTFKDGRRYGLVGRFDCVSTGGHAR